MTEFLPLLMVAALFLLLFAGYPVAFTLGGVAFVFGWIGLEPGMFGLLPQRIWGVMTNFTLLAVPLFIFMGVALERSGLAEELLDAMSLVFGKLRGGHAYAIVIAGALLAASTGIVGASVVTMGLISLPVMLKNNYPKTFSCGIICASGTLGQIIPPSIVLILLGDIMGVSVGELFLAAVVPGLLLVAGYLIYSVLWCYTSKEGAACAGQESLGAGELAKRLFSALLPPGFLICAVLGSIFFGIASPTEAAAVGAFGALLLTAIHRKLSYSTLRDIMDTTVKLTSMVFMILLGAAAFGLVFRGLYGDDLVTELVLETQVGSTGFLVGSMLLLFVLGCFLDFIEIVFIVVPIMMPIAAEFDFNNLWFAVVIALNLQMSFLTPPLGFALFYLRGVAPPEVSCSDIYRGIVPFVLIQALVLAAVVIFPELVTWLPGQIE
ncbi:MAG: TRAP transporter large permease subunit [Bdellovibrionales bacterium]|nr:TRAP transporter large permease subunit [Bdellovibrionales bacterium]